MNTRMQDIINASNRIGEMTMMQAIERGEEIEDDSQMILDYMERVSKKAEKILLERVKEEDFVRAVAAMCAALVTAKLVYDADIQPLIFLKDGDMPEFVHTIFLTSLGMLIDEEVI